MPMQHPLNLAGEFWLLGGLFDVREHLLCAPRISLHHPGGSTQTGASNITGPSICWLIPPNSATKSIPFADWIDFLILPAPHFIPSSWMALSEEAGITVRHYVAHLLTTSASSQTMLSGIVTFKTAGKHIMMLECVFSQCNSQLRLACQSNDIN